MRRARPIVAAAFGMIALALSTSGCAVVVQELRGLDVRRVWAFFKDGEGNDLRWRGDYEPAIEIARETLALRERVLGPEHPLVADNLERVAGLLALMGEYGEAEAAAQRALAIMERVFGPEHLEVAETAPVLADLLDTRGDLAGARRLLERSLRIRERELGADHLVTSWSMTGLAHVLASLGELPDARRLFERAHAIQQVAPPYRWLRLYRLSTRITWYAPSPAVTTHNVAYIRTRLGDRAGARPLLEQALALREAALGPRHPAVAFQLTQLAWNRLETGDAAGAQPLFERAVGILRAARRPELLWNAVYGLGCSQEQRGDLERALASYEDAVATLQGLAGQFTDAAARQRYLARGRMEPYDRLAQLLLKLHERAPHEGYERRAWSVLDAKKGRLVAEALSADGPVVGDRAAHADVRRLRGAEQRMHALESDLRSEQEKAPDRQERQRIDYLTSVLAGTKREYLTQIDGFLARYPRYKAQFVDQQTVDPRLLAKFAGRLPPGTLAVQYFAAPDALYVFVVGSGGRFEVKSRPVPQRELYDLVNEYRAAIERIPTQPLPWSDDGSELYRTEVAPLKALTARLAAHLIGPIEDELRVHQDLIVIPNDLLFYLPFHALTREVDGRPRFLAETHRVSYVTQLEFAEALTASRPSSRRPVLALANPDGSLPGAAAEVSALTAMRDPVTALQGRDASKERFLALADRFLDIHLATHGVLDPVRPQRSYLLMAGTDDASRRLGVADIMGLNLAPTTLVVLSACETGLGEQVPGAALMTLAAAFSQAGSESVVASLWKVSDEATRDFMTALHRALPHTSRAEAMQQAALAVLRNPATAHPFYWAPFVLIGGR